MSEDTLGLILAISFVPTIGVLVWIVNEVSYYIIKRRVDKSNNKNKGFTYDSETGRII